MMTSRCWFRVPAALRFVLKGALPPFVTGKDLILHIIGLIGVDGALYKSMEFSGEGVAALSMDDRFTVCNMAIEAGAKNGIFPVDESTLAYLAGRFRRPVRVYEADADAPYDATYTIDLSQLKPTVSFPSLPENTHTSWGNIASTRSSSLLHERQDLRSATGGRGACGQEGRKKRTLHRHSRHAGDLSAGDEEGLLEAFIRAGASSPPHLRACLGGYMGILADHEKCVSTTNRNFVGRMGHVTSEVYLASPYTAAASAVLGRLATAQEVLQ